MDTPNERALKGRNTVTFPRQDLEAKCREFGKRHTVAIDEGNVWEGFCNALSGLRSFVGRCSQGVALGFHVLALSARDQWILAANSLQGNQRLPSVAIRGPILP